MTQQKTCVSEIHQPATKQLPYTVTGEPQKSTAFGSRSLTRTNLTFTYTSQNLKKIIF